MRLRQANIREKSILGKGNSNHKDTWVRGHENCKKENVAEGGGHGGGRFVTDQSEQYLGPDYKAVCRL